KSWARSVNARFSYAFGGINAITAIAFIGPEHERLSRDTGDRSFLIMHYQHRPKCRADAGDLAWIEELVCRQGAWATPRWRWQGCRFEEGQGRRFEVGQPS